MRRFFTIVYVCLGLFSFKNLAAQGCVAVRGFGGCGVAGGTGLALAPGQWQVGANYRYFKSFRHFRGDEEQFDRLVKQTQVINYANIMELSASYGLNANWQMNLGVPLSYTDRSSYYEHGGQSADKTVKGVAFAGARKTSTSSGLGDARIGVSRWLWNPASHSKSNLAFGASLKLPTGNWNVKDSFYHIWDKRDSVRKTLYRPVDQSIQLGDGGLGLIIDMQGFWEVEEGLYIYGSAFYLFNPRGVNGTLTNRSATVGGNVYTNEYMCSVPDQYAARIGVLSQSRTHGLSFSWGARIEGIPVKDVIGESLGFRRPGYIISSEPGVSYMKGKATYNLNVPIAMYRMRGQSVTDKQIQDAAGIARNGDAAFADYLISFGVTYRLSAPQSKGILSQ